MQLEEVLATTTVSTQFQTNMPMEVDETQLTAEIGELWEAHLQAKSALGKSRKEMKAIRARLAQQLYALKQVLCRPGRGGAWSSFLAEQKIPRSTADGICRAFARSQSIMDGDGNCLSEQILEHPGDRARSYCKGLWPKLKTILTTREAAVAFVEELTSRLNTVFGASGDGIDSAIPDAWKY